MKSCYPIILNLRQQDSTPTWRSQNLDLQVLNPMFQLNAPSLWFEKVDTCICINTINYKYKTINI